jgi:FMN hydrolase / 5-amino-6-(5-phospho-D-ribitylamino)uracil phosphatase
MLDLTPIRAISLDLDDTLWPVWPTIERAEQALQGWLQVHAPAAAVLGQNPQLRQAIRLDVQKDFCDRPHDLGAMRQESIRRLLVQAGQEPGLAPAAYEVFHEHRQRVELFADAKAFLQCLKRHFPLVAISNGTADVHRVGLGEYFSHAVNAPALGVAKPNPQIYHHAARLLDLAPHQVLHIGDDAHLDAWGARNAGMVCIWVNRHGQPWQHGGEAPPMVSDLQTLTDWIGQAKQA